MTITKVLLSLVKAVRDAKLLFVKPRFYYLNEINSQ